MVALYCEYEYKLDAFSRRLKEEAITTVIVLIM